MGHHPPTHAQLLSMNEAANKKTQRFKVTQNDPLYWLRSRGGQQEEEHGVVPYAQGESYQIKVLSSHVS